MNPWDLFAKVTTQLSRRDRRRSKNWRKKLRSWKKKTRNYWSRYIHLAWVCTSTFIICDTLRYTPVALHQSVMGKVRGQHPMDLWILSHLMKMNWRMVCWTSNPFSMKMRNSERMSGQWSVYHYLSPLHLPYHTQAVCLSNSPPNSPAQEANSLPVALRGTQPQGKGWWRDTITEWCQKESHL